MDKIEILVQRDVFKLAQIFTISRGSRTQADVLTVTLRQVGYQGHGECVPYARYGETMESVEAQVNALPETFDRATLQSLLPAGAARNAVDCALWDLEAKQAGKSAWQLAGLPEPKPEITAYTLSLDTPEKMQAQAKKNGYRPLLKTKLGGGDEDILRIKAVRSGAPDAKIIVDANEGWTPELYAELAPVLVELGVAMVEQPFPAGADDALLDLERVLPVCADESCHDRSSLAALKGKYDMINIKLDKTGGLTEALALKDAAIAQGFQVMVGCMVGSSLAMAPAILVAQGVEIVDLDGPLLLGEDRNSPLQFNAQGVHPSTPDLWDNQMNRTVFVNGEYLPEDQATVSIFDRGFLMADAVYEVVSVLDGKLLEFSGHIKRLERSLGELDMGKPKDFDNLLEIHRELVARNNVQEGGIYLQITRGVADRDFVYPKDVEPTLVMFSQERPIIEAASAKNGMKIISVEDQRWGRRDIKTVQLLYPSMAKMMAKAAGVDDAWLVEDGFVTEGTSNNAYIVKDGKIITRSLSHDILHGITRASVLRYAAEAQMVVEERNFTITEAQNADEAFISSASAFVTPVVEVDGTTLGDGKPGPVALRLREIYIEESRKSAI